MRAHCKDELGQTHAAIDDMEMASKIQPSNYSTYYWKGELFKKLNNKNKAIEQFKLASQYKPDFKPAKERLQELQQSPTAKAVLADTAVKIKQNQIIDNLEQGRKFAEQGQYQQAIIAYSEVLKHDPNYVAALKERAASYLGIGRKSEALADYDRIIKINPNMERYYNERAVTYEKLNMPEKALTDYDQIIRLNPTRDTPHYQKAAIYEKMQTTKGQTRSGRVRNNHWKKQPRR